MNRYCLGMFVWVGLARSEALRTINGAYGISPALPGRKDNGTCDDRRLRPDIIENLLVRGGHRLDEPERLTAQDILVNVALFLSIYGRRRQPIR